MKLALFFLVIAGITLLFFLQKTKKPNSMSESYELTREDIRQLILGTRNKRVYRTNYGFQVDRRDVHFSSLELRYQTGKLFGLASLEPNNQLVLANRDTIAPHSRQHGLESGQHAQNLRLDTLEKYGIDLDTLTDLEAMDSTDE